VKGLQQFHTEPSERGAALFELRALMMSADAVGTRRLQDFLLVAVPSPSP
jgi:hypothetical protein